jgi:hypothetical protein
MPKSKVDPAALVAGSIRLASGVSFLVSPEKANRFWGDKEEPVTTMRQTCSAASASTTRCPAHSG